MSDQIQTDRAMGQALARIAKGAARLTLGVTWDRSAQDRLLCRPQACKPYFTRPCRLQRRSRSLCCNQLDPHMQMLPTKGDYPTYVEEFPKARPTCLRNLAKRSGRKACIEFAQSSARHAILS